MGGIFINKYNADNKEKPMKHLGASAGTTATVLFFVLNYPFAQILIFPAWFISIHFFILII